MLCNVATDSFNAFVKLGPPPYVSGESTDSAHPGWIDVQSFSWGVSRAETANAPAIQSFTFTKKLDTASPSLFLACCKGDHVTSLTLGLNRTIASAGTVSKPQIMVYSFFDVFLESIKHTGNTSGGDLPSEEVTFTFQKIEWTYTPLDPVTFQPLLDSTITGGWDVSQNQPKNSANPIVLKME